MTKKSTRRCAVYRIYGARDRLLYVGATINPESRFAQRKRDKSWWRAVKRSDITWYDTEDEALTVERQAIKNEHPKHNEVHRLSTALRHDTVRKLVERTTASAGVPYHVSDRSVLAEVADVMHRELHRDLGKAPNQDRKSAAS